MRNASIRRLASGGASPPDASGRLRIYEAALERLAFGADSGKKPAAVTRAGAALKSLQRGLTGDRRLAGERYFSEADYLKVYLLYYWPVSFVQVTMALEELRARGELPNIERILDIGAGPGPASFAAAAASGTEGGEVCHATLLDWNAEALEAAARLAAIGDPASVILTLVTRNLETAPQLEGGPYDLIVACHSANELWKESADALGRRTALFRRACGLLSENGVLLVVEPSATVTSRPALALRDRLLADSENAGTGGDGLRCVGPCPGSYPCPIAAAGGERSCHSTWLWTPPAMVADLAREAGLDRDSVKATWFALKRNPHGVEKPPARLATSVTVLTGTGPDVLSGRIVSEPMLNKAGRIRYIMCAPQGLVTISAKRDTPAAMNSGFLALRRGDCVSVAGLERREGVDNFGVTQDTRVDLTLRAPEATGEHYER